MLCFDIGLVTIQPYSVLCWCCCCCYYCSSSLSVLSHPEKPGRANPSAFLCNTSNDHGILSRHDLGPCGNTQKAVEAVLDLERFSSKHHATVVSYRSFAKKRQFTASAVIFVHVHVRPRRTLPQAAPSLSPEQAGTAAAAAQRAQGASLEEGGRWTWSLAWFC